MNLRQYARGKPCQIRLVGICNRDDTTTVLCHVRLMGITGTGLKADDVLGAWGCSACHEWTERRNADNRTQRDFYEGMVRTQNELRKAGILRVDFSQKV